MTTEWVMFSLGIGAGTLLCLTSSILGWTMGREYERKVVVDEELASFVQELWDSCQPVMKTTKKEKV